MITIESPHELQTMQFSMTPYWAKKPMDLINAMTEGDKNPGNEPGYSGPFQIFLKQAFIKPLQNQRYFVLAYTTTGKTPTPKRSLLLLPSLPFRPISCFKASV